jgi:hypothetical protein
MPVTAGVVGDLIVLAIDRVTAGRNQLRLSDPYRAAVSTLDTVTLPSFDGAESHEMQLLGLELDSP